jgi:biopolymer transport protein ExbD
MAMSIPSAGSGDPMVDMNTTPLIDVLLVLLIMFIITLPMMTHSVRIDMPKGDGNATREVINLAVEFDGTIVWNGAVIDDLDQLERTFRTVAANATQPELHVRADKRAAYDRVAQVLGRAQRSGIKNIGMIGND